MDFHITSHKCLVWQYLEQVWLSVARAQGQCHSGYFVIALEPTFIGLKYNFIQMLNMTISRAFDFRGPGFKVKVTVAIFKKTVIIALAPTFIDGF